MVSGSDENRLGNNSNEVDKASSAACTKSGAFALALSLVLLFLIHDWKRRPTEQALADYVVNRILLNMNLDQLDQDPVWLNYKSLHPGVELIPISQLPTTFTYVPPQSTNPSSNSAPKPSKNSKVPNEQKHSGNAVPSAVSVALPQPVFRRVAAQVPPKSPANGPPPPSFGPLPKSKPSGRDTRRKPSGPPPPPTLLTVTVSMPIPEITEIVVLEKKLNDSDLLKNASGYSNYYLFSISRWIQKKRMLVWHDESQNHCPVTQSIDLPTGPNPKVLSDCLTIQDWRDLAAFEMPTMGSPDHIGGEFRRDIDISVGALPKRVDEASFVVAALLVFTLLYFGAFLREATHSENFPADGTLFGAFSRTSTANMLILSTLLFPSISSLAVAIASSSRILFAEFALVALATIWVFGGFWRKSYFRPSIGTFATKANSIIHVLKNRRSRSKQSTEVAGK